MNEDLESGDAGKSGWTRAPERRPIVEVHVLIIVDQQGIERLIGKIVYADGPMMCTDPGFMGDATFIEACRMPRDGQANLWMPGPVICEVEGDPGHTDGLSAV